MSKDTRSRHWILTNNYKNSEPIEDKELLDYIKEINGLVFTVFQLERGEKETLHHQIYLSFKNAERFSKVKKAFPNAHIEKAKGSPQQVYDYCTKDDTRVNPPNEWGELPKQGKRNDLTEIMELLEDGASTFDIMKQYPSQYLRYETAIEKASIKFLEEKYRNEFRQLDVIYLSDEAGVGKTRYIMEKHGYGNVYRVSNYKHPFDAYKGEKVIVFEEFRNSLPIEQMLNYLDGYPLTLPARYFDKIACYTKVYVVSNWNYYQQYERVKKEYRKTWNAWNRRIHFKGNLDEVKEYELLQDTPIEDRPLYKKAVEIFGEDTINVK